MQMRPSRVLRKLRAGEAAVGYWTSLPTARVAELAAMLGFDCLWACREHVANDWSVLEEQIRAAKIYDADLMARVSRGTYSNYIRPPELGYRFIAMGDDILAISLHCKRVLTELAKHGAGSGPPEQPGWMFDSM